jgi:hypothetical protein
MKINVQTAFVRVQHYRRGTAFGAKIVNAGRPEREDGCVPSGDFAVDDR